MSNYVVTLNSSLISKTDLMASMSLAVSGATHFPNRSVEIIRSMSFSDINIEYSMSLAEVQTFKSASEVNSITRSPNTGSIAAGRWQGSVMFNVTSSGETLYPESGALYSPREGDITQSYQWGTYYRGMSYGQTNSTWARNLKKSSSFSARIGYQSFNPFHEKVNQNMCNWGLIAHNSKETDPRLANTEYWGKDWFRYANRYIIGSTQYNNTSYFMGDFSGDATNVVPQGTDWPAGGNYTHSYVDNLKPLDYPVIGAYDRARQPYTYHLDGTGVDIIGIEYNAMNDSYESWKDKDGNNRFQNFNWTQSLGVPGETMEGTSPYFPTYDYSQIQTGWPHQTECLAIAAGKWNGWAKGANIYYYRYDPIGLFGTDPMASCVSKMQAFSLIRKFHISKSTIDPDTGWNMFNIHVSESPQHPLSKRPTVITDSTALVSFFPLFESPTSEYYESDNKTHINSVFYSGSLYNNTATSISHQGANQTVKAESANDMSPRLDYGMIHYVRNNTSGSIWTNQGVNGTNAANTHPTYLWMQDPTYKVDLDFLVAEMNELTKLKGVIYCKAAGNNANPYYRAPIDSNDDSDSIVRTEGVMPQYRSNHYDNYFTYNLDAWHTEANDPIHYMRPGCSTDTVLVGAVSNYLTPKNMSNGGNLGRMSGSFPDNCKFETPAVYSCRGGGIDVYAAAGVWTKSHYIPSAFNIAGEPVQGGWNINQGLLNMPAYSVTSANLDKWIFIKEGSLGGDGDTLFAGDYLGYNQVNDIWSTHTSSNTHDPFIFKGGPHSNMGYDIDYKGTGSFTAIAATNINVTRSYWMNHFLTLNIGTVEKVPTQINSGQIQPLPGLIGMPTSSLFYHLRVGTTTNPSYTSGDPEFGEYTDVQYGNKASSMKLNPATCGVQGTGGTSYAAPQVAGVACLFLQSNPTATALDFKKWLKYHGEILQTTESFGSPSGSSNFALEDTWQLFNTNAWGGPYGNMDDSDSTHLNVPTASRPPSYSSGSIPVLYNPYHSPFKTNLEAKKLLK